VHIAAQIVVSIHERFGSTHLAGVFNDATINKARERIFHHPDDASIFQSEHLQHH
jgi:hypothetical protein